MIPTRDSWRRMLALLHQEYPIGSLRQAMRRTAAEDGLGVPIEGLVGHLHCWWGPVVAQGADRFDLDAGGSWALLLPVHGAVAVEGGPEFRRRSLDHRDIADVLAIPLWPTGGEAGPKGWQARRWRRFLGVADVLCPWAIGMGGPAALEGEGWGVPDEPAEPRLFREPLGWLAAGAPLARAAVVLRWSRPVLAALARCRPIAEDEAHAAEIARRLRDHALADLPEVRFPKRLAA